MKPEDVSRPRKGFNMVRLSTSVLIVLAARIVLGAGPAEEQRAEQVAATEGLTAFWDFSLMEEGKWTSYHDENVVEHGYPVVLRRIGDPRPYTPQDWPYDDEQSKLMFDSSGPFGHAVRFNKGYVFAEVPRSEFDRSPLDIHGQQPFTLIAWVKFVGKRHLVAGIWDEGGWDKYGGRRQIALFGGLFGSKGVIGHISATGASSYPQSTISGSQYARCRAIDGRGFENGHWVAMATTFDPTSNIVTVYCDGVATPTQITDPVANDIFKYEEPIASNPYHFPWPIYSPRSFVLKFNGYDVQSSGVYEHWLRVDAVKGTVAYDRRSPDPEKIKKDYWVDIDVRRVGKSILTAPVTFEASSTNIVELPVTAKMQPDDEIITSLQFREGGGWRRVGKEIRYRLREGAPFTFGRALGLGTEPIDHGTQLYIDGVAVFDRVLTTRELKKLAFNDTTHTK
jgi:hypothetical protein